MNIKSFIHNSLSIDQKDHKQCRFIGHLIILIYLARSYSVCTIFTQYKPGINFASPQGAAWMGRIVILREWHKDKHIICTTAIRIQTPGGTHCFTRGGGEID